MSSAIEVDENKIFCARLVCSERITPAVSPEDVKNLVFSVEDSSFDCRVGQSVRVLAPGQSGNKYHARLYSIADFSGTQGYTSEFTLCVRRCNSLDAASGEEIPGVASNYLCNLKPGGTIEFSGPFGYPFPIPENRHAGIIMLGVGTGIAPFRFLIKRIYENLGGWDGKVRLFYGAPTGLELLYMNDTNSELARYYDEETFRAFRALSPNPSSDAPVEWEPGVEQHAAELAEMLSDPDTHVYLAGRTDGLAALAQALAVASDSAKIWPDARSRLMSSGRWIETLY